MKSIKLGTAFFALLLPTAVPAAGQPSTRAAEQSTQTALFLINYRAGPQWRPGVPMRDQGLGAHFHYIKARDEAGRIAVARPAGDDAGMILLWADSLADAHRIGAADPAVTTGLFTGDAQPFQARFVGEERIAPANP